MAQREVKIGGATYLRGDMDDVALWGFALHGEKVDVRDDDLERFDRLNVPAEPTGQDSLPAANSSSEDVEDESESKRITRKPAAKKAASK